MKGYFTFNLTVSDGLFFQQVPVKIVMIGIENIFSMTFDNPVAEVEKHKEDITRVFDSAFPDWKFNSGQTEDVSTSSVRMDQTKLECHFLNRATYEPVLKDEVAV